MCSNQKKIQTVKSHLNDLSANVGLNEWKGEIDRERA